MVTTAAGCKPRLDRLKQLPRRLHRNLLDEGVIISKEGLGCLSTPMGEVEVDQFVKALERAVARLRKG
jgi:glutamate-1-semialdehyde aminotransferase